MTRELIAHCGIIDWMGSRCAALRGDGLRAPQMQRRLAGYFGAEAKADAAVMASLLRHRAQRVTLGMTARPAAWTTGHSRSGDSGETHDFILAVCFAATGSILMSLKLRIRVSSSL